MRYIVYNVRAINASIRDNTPYVLGEHFATLELAKDWCDENNRELANQNNTERWEPFKVVLWLKAFGEICNGASCLAFLFFWSQGNLKQAGFLVLARIMLFGIPIVTLRPL